MFKLNNIKAPAGSNPAPKRKGLGIGSKLGKTAGKGHKGSKARSGGAKPKAVFEGGQMPLARKLPKVGFRSPLKPLQVKINITELSKWAAKAVTIQDLAPAGKAKNPRIKVSIFGNKAPKSWPKSVELHHVAPAAKALLEKNGVAIEVKPYMNGALGKKKSKVERIA
jgi:large subunit ribosomal protein L15